MLWQYQIGSSTQNIFVYLISVSISSLLRILLPVLTSVTNFIAVSQQQELEKNMLVRMDNKEKSGKIIELTPHLIGESILDVLSLFLF